MVLSWKRKMFLKSCDDATFHYRCLLLSKSLLNPSDGKMALRAPVDPSRQEDELLVGPQMTHWTDFDTRVGRRVLTVQGKARKRFIFTYRYVKRD